MVCGHQVEQVGSAISAHTKTLNDSKKKNWLN